jgi:hypothetical protein
MRRKNMNILPATLNEHFIEIEVNVTPEEDAELQSIAAAHQISVPELLRREALRATNESAVRNQSVAKVLKSVQGLRDTTVGSGPISPTDVGEILLQLADSIEQLIGPANVELKVPYGLH